MSTDLRRVETIPFEEATVAEVVESGDPLVAELYHRSLPLILATYSGISLADYWQLTTRQHILLAKVAGRLRPAILEACDLTLEDLGLSGGGSEAEGVG